MKKIVSLFLSFVMLASITAGLDFSAYAVTSSDGLWGYTVSGSEATDVLYLGDGTDVTVPETIDGYTVTSVGTGTYGFCIYSPGKVESITLPATVTTVGRIMSDDLKSITIPAAKVDIGGYAFNNSKLESITLNSVGAIGTNAFDNCSSLKTVTINGGVEEIGGTAFYQSAVESVSITGDVGIIDFQAFMECDKLSSFTANSVKQIKDKAFSNCNNLSRFSFNGVEEIGESAFYNCAFTSVILPNSLKALGTCAFESCYKMIDLKVSGNNLVISDAAFVGCNYLINVEIGKGVTELGEDALPIEVLTTLTLSNTIKEINYKAFNEANNRALTIIYNGRRSEFFKLDYGVDIALKFKVIFTVSEEVTGGEDDPVFNVDDWTIKEDYDGTYGISAYLGSEKNVLVPAELDGKKIKRICNNAFLNSSVTSVVLQNGIEELQEYSFVSSTIKYIALPDSITYFGAKFRYAHCLEKIDLPSTLTYISSNCFENCKELRELDIPDSVEEIDCYAFRNCPKLERIKLPANLKELYYGTFKNCTSLMAISIPGSVESIQYDTFNGCTSLAYVTLNNGIKQIDNNAFYNCSSLKEINIPASVIYIDNNPFKGCNSVKSVVVDSNNLVFDSRENCNAIIETAENCLVVGFAASTIPSSVIGLGKWAFGFSEIESIDLPEGLIYFGESAFAYCNQLKSLSIPKNVKYISDNLCARCENLTSVSIPEGVLSIGDSFFGCTSLKEITIPDSVTFIGSFSGDTSLTKVNFGKGLKVIDDYAFNGCTALKNLSLPNGLRYIGDNAFIGCSSLTSVTIPETVENIGAFSFKGCTALDNIVIPEKAISIGVSAFVDTAYYNKESNWIFYHTAGQFMKQLYIGKHLILSIMFYVSSSEVPSFNYTETGDVLPIKNGTITIADCANHENISGYVSGANSDYSSKYPKVTTVIIPDSVKHIGAASFTRIDTLENVTLPASLEEIGNYAFYQCKLNANMKIPRSVTHVGQDAFTFKDYPEGEDVIVDDVLVKKKKDDGVIKDGIRIIADRACQENFQTDVINIPSSVETIGQYAFYGSSASKINFSYGIKRIYKNAFSEMSNLEYVSVIPDSVTYLGAPIFDDMHRNYLRTLQLPNGINNIDFSVISGTDIDTLVIPKSVKTIYCSGGYNSFSENGFKIYYEGTEAEWKNIEIKESSYSNERFIVLQYADYCKMYENDSYTRENCTPMEELLANAEMHYNCNYYTSSGDNNPGSETPQTPQSQPAQSSNNGASSPTATTPPASQTPVTKITLKKVTVKKSAKKLVLQATVKVDGKAVKGKKVTFKFNGKKYTAKTNAKGIAKVTIKKSVLKKLKVGKKVTYTVTWNKITAKRSVKVKK